MGCGIAILSDWRLCGMLSQVRLRSGSRLGRTRQLRAFALLPLGIHDTRQAASRCKPRLGRSSRRRGDSRPTPVPPRSQCPDIARLWLPDRSRCRRQARKIGADGGGRLCYTCIHENRVSSERVGRVSCHGADCRLDRRERLPVLHAQPARRRGEADRQGRCRRVPRVRRGERNWPDPRACAVYAERGGCGDAGAGVRRERDGRRPGAA